MNYYNEFDPKAAAWLRDLIYHGYIPPGLVDTRSILDVNPNELTKFKQCHFFAGIGGWSLALHYSGWPEDQTVWTGSCPCQPFSNAGKQLGIKDERHLWPQFARLIAECRPPVVFGEQVASKAGREWLAGVRTDLERVGYAVGVADLCAAGVGAPHIRQRLYWVGDSKLHGFVADPIGCGVKSSETQSGVLKRERPNSSDRLDNTSGYRREGGAQLLRKHDGQEPLDGRESSRLEHTESDGRLQRRTESGGRILVCGCSDCRMGISNCAGRNQGGAPTTPTRQRDSVIAAGFWGDYELICCRDGKSRRIESGTFPLAYGIPNRVGLLRGYGNAIVPQIAAEFIIAYQETLTELMIEP